MSGETSTFVRFRDSVSPPRHSMANLHKIKNRRIPYKTRITANGGSRWPLFSTVRAVRTGFHFEDLFCVTLAVRYHQPHPFVGVKSLVATGL